MNTTIINCAFCRVSLKNNESDIVAVCKKCRNSSNLSGIDKLTAIDRNFFDNLEYGNIILDESNNIVKYNKAEAEFTGFEIEKVEGKSFFKEIAPCTEVYEFKGKLDDLIKNNFNGQYHFSFKFKHPRFESVVSIIMTYLVTSNNSILSIKPDIGAKSDY